MSGFIKALAGTAFLGGWLTVLAIDVLTVVWISNTHGIGWAIISVATLAPMIVFPFAAGYGGAFVAGFGLVTVGYCFQIWAQLLDEREIRRLEEAHGHHHTHTTE